MMDKMIKQYEWYRQEYKKIDSISEIIAYVCLIIGLVLCAISNTINIPLAVMVGMIFLILAVPVLTVGLVIRYVDKHEKKLAEK